MSWEPEGGWATPPPAPLLECLDTLIQLRDGWERTVASPSSTLLDPKLCEGMQRMAHQAAQLLASALKEEYAP